jgi:hypothetical protein
VTQSVEPRPDTYGFPPGMLGREEEMDDPRRWGWDSNAICKNDRGSPRAGDPPATCAL